MKKSLCSLMVMAALTLFCAPLYAAEEQNEVAAANPAGNPIDQFTGKVWMNSTEDNKGAFLFGIDSAVAVEYFINSKQTTKSAKAGKKPVYTLSPFEKGWMEALKNVTRAQLIKMVDDWYTAHPEDLDKPVLNVIWYQVIEPRLAEQKTSKQ